MPLTPRERVPRKGQFSCNFCRLRKLRCDRPLPCTSCRSRGKTCEFNPTVTAAKVSIDPHSTTNATGHPTTISATASQADLLAEVQALRRLAHGLEARVASGSTTQHQHNVEAEPYISPATSAGSNDLQKPLASSGEVPDIVSQLQLVSMGQVAHTLVGVDDIMFKTEHIRSIPQAPGLIAHLGQPTTCVWLPTRDEAMILVDYYLTTIDHIQHIVHQPSLPSLIEDVYKQIRSELPLKSGHIVLLLSIIASTTRVWRPNAGAGAHGEYALFLSSTQAHAQTTLWIKAAHRVLNATQTADKIQLEMIQGIIILNCVVCNVEGLSLRYRSLHSTGLLLGRELGLHRMDHDPKASPDCTLKAEMGRRIWWYMAATDWFLAARFGGPCEGVYQCHPLHMTVNKPLNVNDEDLTGTGPLNSLPHDRPTDMSYFILRIRLAEISRSIVDHNLSNVASCNRPNYYAHIMAMDFEIDQVMRDIPPFFNMDAYAHDFDSDAGIRIFLQAYMLNSHMHTQRCKLHIGFLTSSSKDNPAYAASRDTCLKSARQIVHAEVQMLQSKHPFVQVRLGFAAFLYGLFMASIALLMDTCIHKPDLLEHDVSVGDLADALRMIQEMNANSLAAATMHESLMQIIARYRAQHRHSQTEVQLSPTSQAITFDDSMFLDNTQWDDLFTGLASSSFF